MTRHLTVFEMLGSWSLGDYEGPQSLRWGYELITDGFGIGRDRLHATVFGGDDQVGPDTESLRTWEELGVPAELTTGDNWWSNGPTGPCGPDSELFVWTGDGPPRGTPGTDERWMELWNHVTMRYRRHRRRPPRAAAAAQRGHRHGPGAAADGPAGQPVGVRHRRLPALDATRCPACGGPTSGRCACWPTICAPAS